MSFTATQIKLFMATVGNPVGDLTVDVYSHASNDLDAATLVATGTRLASELSGFGVKYVQLDASLELVSNTYYWVTCALKDPANDSSNYVYIIGANQWITLNGGILWEYDKPGYGLSCSGHLCDSSQNVLLECGTLSGGNVPLYGALRWYGSPSAFYTGPPGKPTNPSPGDTDTDVVTDDTPLSYDASADGEADSYDIYFEKQGEVLVKIADTQDITSWKMPFVVLGINDYNPATGSGYRSPEVGDVLTHGDDEFLITHVVVGDLVNVEYEAKLYAFRRTGPGGKSPGDVLTNGVAPDTENPQAVSVTLNDAWHFHGEVEAVFLPQGDVFEWRVDATNAFGTTTGSTWTFTSIALDPPLPSGYSLDFSTNPAGVPTSDGSPAGGNNMLTIRKLVAAAGNKFWYEDI